MRLKHTRSGAPANWWLVGYGGMLGSEFYVFPDVSCFGCLAYERLDSLLSSFGSLRHLRHLQLTLAVYALYSPSATFECSA